MLRYFEGSAGSPMKLVSKSLERVFYSATNPISEWLLRVHVRPNTLTTIGAILVVVSAIAFAMGFDALIEE